MTIKNDYKIALPKLVKGASANFLGAIFGNALRFIYVFILARYLSSNELGIYFLGVNIISILSIIAIAGTDTGIKRFVSIYHGLNDENGMKSFQLASLKIIVPLSLVVGLTLFIFSETIAIDIFSKKDLTDVLKVLSIFFPFYVLTTNFLSTTEAMKYMQYRVISFDIAINIFKIIFAILLFYLGLSLYGAVFSHLVSMILVTSLSYYFFKKVFPRDVRKTVKLEYKKLLFFSIPQAFSNLISQNLGVIDTLILGYFLLADSVGIYNVSLRVALLATSVLGSFNKMFAPMISDLHYQKNYAQLEKLYKIVTKWIFTFSLPIILFIIFFSDKVLSVMGTDYTTGSRCLIILCIGQIINASTGPSGFMVLMSGHQYISLFNNLLSIILFIILNFILIPIYGIVGAAIAASTTMGLVNIIRILQVYYLMRIHPYNLSYLKSLFSGLTSMIVVYYGSHLIHIHQNFFTLTVLFVAFLFLYSICLFLLKLDDADQFILAKIKPRISLFNYQNVK